MAKVGRPTKLTPEIADKIIELAEVGATKTSMCNCVRIRLETLNDWLDRGNKGESPFSEFSDRYFIARSEAEKYCLDQIKLQAKDDYKAACRLLQFMEVDTYKPMSGVTGDFRHDVNLDISEGRKLRESLTNAIAKASGLKDTAKDS
jgi:hypothetical protein